MALLIVGIDPGTTTAYAALDTKGRLVRVESSKELGLGNLISSIVKYGRTIIAATDKAVVPGLVHEAAAKLGAKITAPREDLLVKDKRKMVSEFEAALGAPLELNSHELDALAAAIYSYRRNKPLLFKIRAYLERKERLNLFEEFTRFVIKNENLDFDTAISFFDRRPQPASKKKRTHETTIPTKPLDALQSKISLLEDNNKLLKKRTDELEREQLRLLKKREHRPRDILLAQKEERLRTLLSEREAYELRLRELENELKKRDEFISSISGGILVKKLKDMSLSEYEAKKFLRITDEDFVFVENPAIRSEKIISCLKKTAGILSRGPIKGFFWIDSKNIILADSANYCIADKKMLSERLRKKTLLSSVVEEYRREREHENC